MLSIDIDAEKLVVPHAIAFHGLAISAGSPPPARHGGGVGSNWESATVLDWRDRNNPTLAADHTREDYAQPAPLTFTIRRPAGQTGPVASPAPRFRRPACRFPSSCRGIEGGGERRLEADLSRWFQSYAASIEAGDDSHSSSSP